MWQNRIVLGIFIIGMGVYASNYGGRISYTFFYLALLIPFICILYTVYVYMRFKFFQTTSERKVQKKEPADYLLQIGNEDIMAYSNIKVVFFDENVTMLLENKDAEFSLVPGDKKKIETKICCEYRGEYYVGAEYFIITDPLLLFAIKYPVKNKLPVNVIPRIIEWKYPNIIADNEDIKNRFHYGNCETEPEPEVKKYMQGDSLKKVHWKASAKKGELLVRKYEEIPKQKVLLLLDLFPTKKKGIEKVMLEDAIIENAVSFVNFCCNKKVVCRIKYAEEKVELASVTNRKQMEEFYNICCELYFTTDISIHKIVEAAYTREEGEQYVLLTSVLDGELFKLCVKYKNAGKQISLLLVVLSVSKEQEKLMKNLSQLGIKIHLFAIQEKEDIDEK